MKLFCRKVLINGQAFPKSVVEDKMKSFSEEVMNHVADCIMYGKNYKDYGHWIEDELATWMTDGGSLLEKGNKKPKKKVYEDTLFGHFGTTKDDAEHNLNIENVNNQNKEVPYPKVVVDDKMITDCYNACKEIKETMIPIFIANKKLDKQMITKTLFSILDKYSNR